MKVAKQSVELLDHCGTDLSVVDAARVSFNKKSEFEDTDTVCHKLLEKDAKLINYLAKHKHKSPFNHCFMSFRVKAPIFVARQLVKHEYLPWNEVSRRYVTDEPEFYFPDYWRKAADNVKQGSSDEKAEVVFKKGFCGYCGTAYQATSPNQKYCSTNCQANHYRERHPFETKWTRWKASAKARGLEFSISEEDLDWPRYCPYLGVELNYQSDDKADNVASLDRIDSTQGYVKGNVQIVSSLSNKMKSDASKDDLVKFARSVLSIHAGIIVPEKSGVEQSYETALTMYNSLLAQGVCAEQARMFLPQAVMTEWIWSGTLFAFAKMCKLRLDAHTQRETQEIAKMIDKEAAKLYPVSWTALMEYGE